MPEAACVQAAVFFAENDSALNMIEQLELFGSGNELF
jgi:hypothetical protein